MNHHNLRQGLFLVVVVLAFGLPAMQQSAGDLAGFSLLHLLAAAMLMLVGLASVSPSRAGEAPAAARGPDVLNLLSSLCGSALLSVCLDSTVAVVFLAFCAATTGIATPASRNLTLAAALAVVGYGFEWVLGL